ncbi:GIY-YIG nuclease family protein [Bacillus marasmi]|uniref:GIY-YIG nuclease family protein n=1 Tax=Bacillus marasmi TaxID=1926279 RepID=UPI0011C87995|nr:GIY-YIG nuclease family protein [Bacillus marasmi]
MLTEDELNWIRKVLSSDFHSDSKLTEDELNWLKMVIGEDYEYDPTTLPAHYVRLKKAQFERNASKDIVRKNLDVLRDKIKKFTPHELFELKNKYVRESRGIENFAGIYIIHNRVNDKYYVGKSDNVFDRAYKHFLQEPTGNPEIYNDYSCGETFSISLIPLENTSFTSLNELEDNAIRAYDSFAKGYNRMPGNIMDKPFFNNYDYPKVADLILNEIKGTDSFFSLTNDRKRRHYTKSLVSELKLPYNIHFINGFVKVMKEYQKANKKIKK